MERKINKNGGLPVGREELGQCWLWLGAPHKGYGVIKYNKRDPAAHRVMWELERGPIPDDKELHHICEVTLCVNPAHLELLTRGEHIALHKAQRAD